MYGWRHLMPLLADAGYELLIQVAARLRSCVREVDTVSRFGGDEFVVLIGHATDIVEAETMAGRIAEQFALAFTVDGREFTTTASVGIALGVSGIERADPPSQCRYRHVSREINRPRHARRIRCQHAHQHHCSNGT